MLFNSIQFLIFFPVVTLLYYLLPHRFRWAMLLLASCVFYMWFIPKYILILALTILIDYWAGIFIEDSSDTGKKKKWLVFSIISTCLVLFVFKYFNFFNENFARTAYLLGLDYPVNALNIILPIGLSFHTFQSLSYVVEVYRGNQKAERNFGIYSLYVMFYPQLVAGPIERPQNLLHQFYEKHYFEYTRVTDGLKLMAWGLFKKVVIADRLAILVNAVYNNPTAYSGPALITATVFFAFQIYCDFSGYSDIAIGSAQVMGFKLMDNFNRPYFSKSISEFWKRWHISLSTWFRDYLYISLGGNRCSKYRCHFNLFLTFLISGLWHGANWTYVIWGGLNGFYLIFALWTDDLRDRLAASSGIKRFKTVFKLWRIAITFSLICFSWVFFRAKDLTTAVYIIGHFFTGWGDVFNAVNAMRLGTVLDKTIMGVSIGDISSASFLVSVFLLLFLNLIHFVQRHGSIRHMLKDRPLYFRWGIYYTIVTAILLIGTYGNNQFIYFQF